MADQNFKVDPSNFIGIQYQEYRNEMYAKALATPSAYFDLRKKVVKSVKEDAVKDLYIRFYNLLTEGTDANGGQIMDEPPHYPAQKVGDFCLEAAATLNGILDKLVEIILPADFKALAETRTGAIGNAAISNAAGV